MSSCFNMALTPSLVETPTRSLVIGGAQLIESLPDNDEMLGCWAVGRIAVIASRMLLKEPD
jgi:hypothetical protein